jgi:sec-independent protein translocase protein TatA
MELFSPGHLIVLAIIVAVLFFGWKQLPDMARSVGRSLRIFKTEIKGMSEDDRARDDAREGSAKPVIEPASQDAPSPVEKRLPTTGSGSTTAKPNDAA